MEAGGAEEPPILGSAHSYPGRCCRARCSPPPPLPWTPDSPSPRRSTALTHTQPSPRPPAHPFQESHSQTDRHTRTDQVLWKRRVGGSWEGDTGLKLPGVSSPTHSRRNGAPSHEGQGKRARASLRSLLSWASQSPGAFRAASSPGPLRGCHSLLPTALPPRVTRLAHAPGPSEDR